MTLKEMSEKIQAEKRNPNLIEEHLEEDFRNFNRVLELERKHPLSPLGLERLLKLRSRFLLDYN